LSAPRKGRYFSGFFMARCDFRRQISGHFSPAYQQLQ